MPWVIIQLAPVRKFLQSLPDALMSKTHGYINLLAEKGPFLTYPYSKKIATDLHELRVRGRDAIRVFYRKKSRLLLTG